MVCILHNPGDVPLGTKDKNIHLTSLGLFLRVKEAGGDNVAPKTEKRRR